MIFVHGRSLRQILRLLKRLHNHNDYYFIHVDPRSNYLYESLKVLDNGKNVIVTKDRHKIIWGGVSQMQVYLKSMKNMLGMKWGMDFVVTVSGSDYVLKKVEEFRDYLSNHIGRNFVAGLPENAIAKELYGIYSFF